MVKLTQVLNHLNPVKILVVGDIMLDSYTIGKAKRISPEAPVAVVNVLREENRPGGAGNVVLNLLSLGANVAVIGRVGHDWAGNELLKALESEQVDTRMIVVQEKYHTPLKRRIIADNQQIVRVDQEQLDSLEEPLEQMIIDQLPFFLKDVKVIAISDYGKGFLTHTLLKAIIQQAKQFNIPVITDPKGIDFKKYEGTTVIKPNLIEAYAAAKLSSTASLENVAAAVIAQCQAEFLMVTRSELGISLFDAIGNRFDFPVHAKEVKDVTGAGDTVLAMMAYAIGNQISYDEAIHLCNIAAGIAIEQVGCARVSLSDIAVRLFENQICDKVFDQSHLCILQAILQRSLFSVLTLSRLNELTPGLFQMIRSVKRENSALLICIEDPQNCEMLIEMLSSLQEVNFILLGLDSLTTLCKFVNPESTYTISSNPLADLRNNVE